MGEIDTKPIEPVQVGIYLFDEKGHSRKNNSTSSDSENGKEKDVAGLTKDLANYKLQLEAKDSAYKQALLKLEYYQKVADELSSLLKQSEVETEKYKEEYAEARIRIDELESRVKEMAAQLLETTKIRNQLLRVLNELKAAQEELLSMESALAAARELELKAMTQAELMESAANMERDKAEELLRHVSELKEANLTSKLAAVEAEEEKCKILSEKDAEIDLAKLKAAQMQDELEDAKKQVEMMHELEIQLLEKSILSDLLDLELNQSKGLLSLSHKAASDAINDLEGLKVYMEVREREIFDQAIHIEALETELGLLKSELKNASEEIGSLKSNAERLTDELQKAKTKMDKIKQRENEAQVEIALLKSELHKGKSRIAAAEAAEARSQSIKSGLYLAVQQLALEAENAKKENHKLKQGADKLVEQFESVLTNTEAENTSLDVEIPQADESKTESEEAKDENDEHIAISVEEYELLIKKAAGADQTPVSVVEDPHNQQENKYEFDILKKDLEVAMAKIGEFRNRAEQAITRAEAAEKAKAILEDQIKRWQERKQKRKATLAAIKEATETAEPRQQNFPTYEKLLPLNYQPLGKVLNMKF